jgi:hypothetical protein
MPFLISDFFSSPTSSTSGSYVSIGEILTAPPDVKYKDVLLCTKSGSYGDPYGRDPQTLRTQSRR